ncbi:LADA_0G11034g1_1 [Lachancea dasiensis]|uniref:LADA_0G11034g1_1 n=1 Tax=Lachancea dasiensis TaxID=1072105 RepID=A0A1G4JVA3_9SACH|nr:LADA_0G11034g1_1 [Lachancea dasiensis]
MDYMNLGVTSRKTGIKIEGGIGKDEYSMENVDEFFKDEESSMSIKRKSRKSSLLSFQKSVLPEGFADTSRRSSNFLPPSVPTIPEDGNEHSLGQLQDGESFEERNTVEYGINDELSPAPAFVNFPEESNRPKRRPVNFGHPTHEYVGGRDTEADEEEDDGATIPKTPESDYGNESYRDVPDLVADEEDEPSHGNTTFNTSDNALMEDEIDYDYQPHNDNDQYHIGERVQHKVGRTRPSSSDGDDDSSAASSHDDDSEGGNDTGILLGRSTKKQDVRRAIEEEASDSSSEEDFMKNQARTLGEDVNYSKVNGVRKSNRVKIAPLEYWRNERVVYKRKSKKPVLEIDKVITFEKDDDEEEEMKRNKKANTRPFNYAPSGRPRGRPRKNQSLTNARVGTSADQQLIEKIKSGFIQRSEWFSEGIFKGQVHISASGEEGEEVLAQRQPPELEPEFQNGGKEFMLKALFDKQRHLFASGILTIPIGSRKRPSDANNVFLNFYVITGVLEVTINDNSFLCTEGCSFQVPAHNDYALDNKGRTTAKMYFVQVNIFSDGVELYNKIGDGKDTRNSLSDMSISRS